jgi:DNA-binding MarR family transcriptional regulator
MSLAKIQLTENDKRYLNLWPKPDSRWLELQVVADRIGVTTITAAAALSRLRKKELIEKRGDRKCEGGALKFVWLTTDLGDSITQSRSGNPAITINN